MLPPPPTPQNFFFFLKNPLKFKSKQPPDIVPSIENLGEKTGSSKENSNKEREEQQLYIKLPTFSKNLLKNEVFQINTINVPIIRKNSLNAGPKTTPNAAMRRKSQANCYNTSAAFRFGSPIHSRIRTENSCSTPNSRNRVFSLLHNSPSNTSIKTPSNRPANVISFNDVSLYKVNLIDFFREEETKGSRQRNESTETEGRENLKQKNENPIKGIMKSPKSIRKNSEGFGVKPSVKMPGPSVYMRFQDQIMEIPGSLKKKQLFIRKFIKRGQTGFRGISIKGKLKFIPFDGFFWV